MVEYDIDPLSLGILLGIYNGIKDVKKLASYLNVDEDSIKEALRDLEEKGLVKRDKKRILIFEIQDLKLTREGYNTLMVALERLKPKLEEVRKALARGDEEQAITMLGAMGLGLLVPLLIPMLLGGLLLPIGIGLGAPHEHGSHIRPGDPF